MMPGHPELDESWRESAAFDVRAEDYRAAFACAVDSDPTALPAFWPIVRAKALAAWAVALLAAAIGGMFTGFLHLRAGVSFEQSLWAGLTLPVQVAAVMVPVALLIGVWHARDARGWRKRFPALQSQWKRPARMRIRWNAKSLMLVGPQGFATHGWHTLHGWIDLPDTLLLFPAMLEPVPVPHAALDPDDLEDLRAHLNAAEVPAHWQWQADETRQLRRVFG